MRVCQVHETKKTAGNSNGNGEVGALVDNGKEPTTGQKLLSSSLDKPKWNGGEHIENGSSRKIKTVQLKTAKEIAQQQGQTKNKHAYSPSLDDFQKPFFLKETKTGNRSLLKPLDPGKVG